MSFECKGEDIVIHEVKWLKIKAELVETVDIRGERMYRVLVPSRKNPIWVKDMDLVE